MGIKKLAGGLAGGPGGAINSRGYGMGEKVLFGDQAGQAAETARIAEMFRAQQEKARADLMGVLKERPEYRSMLTDPEFAEQKKYAFGDESTKGFLMQRGREQQGLMDALQAQTQAQVGQQANAYSQLAMGGGLSSGARERIAGGGAQSGLLARQALRSQSAKNLTDLGISEEGQRFGTRSGVLQAQMQDLQQRGASEQDAWKTKAQTLAGLSQAEQQQAAMLANRAPDKGMCCFIFLEARYGDGTMDSVVRRYRDEFMTDKNKRGYYKLAEVLVPLMRKYSLVKWAVRVFMTDPLVKYATQYYAGKKPSLHLALTRNFWVPMFSYLGEDHQFIRENGEVV